MQPGHGNKRSRRQEHAIACLLSCLTVKSAAEKAGIAECSLRRWLEDPAFQAKYKAARRRVVDGAIGNLQRATGRAVATLVRLLRCGNPAVEAKAAIAILDQAVKGIELADLQEQVEALEAKFQRKAL